MENQKLEQIGIGHKRPSPSFVSVSVVANEPAVQEPAAAHNMAQLSAPNYATPLDAAASNTSQLAAGIPHQAQSDTDARNTKDTTQASKQLDEILHSPSLSAPTNYKISVDEILLRLREVGIEKSKDSVQRYCREGALDCQKLGLFKRYFATETSLIALIKKMQPDEDARTCMQTDTPASIRDVVDLKHTDAPTSNRTQVHQAEPETKEDGEQKAKASNDESLVGFLKDEIHIKNKQLDVKDTQIAAMLERDRETNILIRGLQNQLGETFALLAGRSNREVNNEHE